MTMIKQYKTKPTVIEAVQWTGANIQEILDFCGKDNALFVEIETEEPSNYPLFSLYIITLEGMMLAKVSDYIIKGVLGEFYPCKKDAFITKYEEIN